jgi:DNA transformation protein
MAVTAGFKAFVLEQLEQSVRDIRSKSMFGGVGIYAGEDFFALIANDVVYFKVDDQTRPKFVRRRMQPFQPYGPDAETMGYYTLPVSVLEDSDALKAWAADAIAVARRAKVKPPKRKAPAAPRLRSGQARKRR